MGFQRLSKEQAKDETKELIEKYNKVIASNKLKSYNEETTKKDFILPLFRALGWNVEDGDEVSAEEKVSKKRVDYGFRLNGIPKFFLEAKALKEDLDNIKFVEQAINYSWHKGCTWAVLTDFESVKIYNAELKSLNPLQAQFGQTLPCNLFLEKFDTLWLLSKEAFEQKLLDTEAEKWGKKTKKIPVDKQLLLDMTMFRELLTKNILKNNESKHYTADQLDEIVQRILDRLIFIRTLEDKELEAPVLKSIVREDTHKRLYKKLNAVYRQIDDIYDSKLFKEHECELLEIDDEVLAKVINGLFDSNDNTVHYDFSAIDADVLGNIYEQYLGHILKKTDKRAKLAEGKAHRKEQGIYYTPTYIVDYIVKNTVGELAKDKKFDIKNIKILDPACGSGSFLMKAFDYLVTMDKKKNGDDDQTKLDIASGAPYGRKIEILKNNIFGVDLDPKATEIAQLNLLLKAAEKKHRLPMLQENIKMGNSLIDDPIVAGDRAFKWKEQFKDIMDKGAFDVVIGNPPWLMAGYYLDEELNFLQNHYSSAIGKFDMYYCFIERGLSLLNENGIFGMIVPNKFFHTKSARELRSVLVKSGRLFKIIDFGYEQIFKDATNYSSILFLRKNSARKIVYNKMNAKLEIIKEFKVDRETLTDDSWYFEDDDEAKIFKKIESCSEKLKDVVTRFGTGAQTGADKILTFKRDETEKFGNEKTLFSDILRGRDVRRYNVQKTKVALFPYRVENKHYKILSEDEIKKYKKIWSYLELNKKELSKRVWFGKNAAQLSGKWYGFMYLDEYQSFETQHILTPSLSNKSNFALGKDVIFVTGTAGVTSIIFKSIPEDIEYMLGILNSKLISFFITKHSPVFQGGYYKFSSNYLKKVPIKRINMNNIAESKSYNLIVELVNKITSLNSKLGVFRDKKTDEKAYLEKEIEQLDREIDEEVYKLYGITKEEKKIIEESLK